MRASGSMMPGDRLVLIQTLALNNNDPQAAFGFAILNRIDLSLIKTTYLPNLWDWQKPYSNQTYPVNVEADSIRDDVVIACLQYSVLVFDLG